MAPRIIQVDWQSVMRAPNERFVPVVEPHNGPGARSAPKRHWLTSQGLCGTFKRRALDWLVYQSKRTPILRARGSWNAVKTPVCAAAQPLSGYPKLGLDAPKLISLQLS